MLIFGLTIFIGAFLLFQVQPVIGKYILPWFGGSPSVWTACLMFFQVALVGGYFYAYVIAGRLKPRSQANVHIVLLVLALVTLPITPADYWKPISTEAPIWRILSLLTVSLGVPYLMLASTGPLLQSWFTRIRPGVSPYRLYALSNVGSLLALISYPFLVEPALSRRLQAGVWSVSFGLFALLSAYCALRFRRSNAEQSIPVAGFAADDPSIPPSCRIRLLWLALPACAALLLMAATNQICQDTAVVPFLWVLPLCLYLLSFIICFERDAWYSRTVFTVLLVVALSALCKIMLLMQHAKLLLQILGYSGALFVCSMVCHGELARLKPHHRYLTSYYLMIAIGGALGGIFVALVAPRIFNIYLELHVGLLGTFLLLLIILFFDKRSALYRKRIGWIWGSAWFVLLVAFGGVATALYVHAERAKGEPLAISRNFYGVIRVFKGDLGFPDSDYHEMRHGLITHGAQFTDPVLRLRPTTYFGKQTGVGLAMRFYRPDDSRRIGILGLGIGTLAAYGKPGDVFRFYEINPTVLHMARTYFTYLSDCKARVEIALGDGRLSLERESPHQFDLLIMDAFSGDALPVHLLTKEALEIYLRHLKPDGILAINVSNIHFRLAPVVFKLAEHFGMESVYIPNTINLENMINDAQWMLVTRNQSFLESDPIRSARFNIYFDLSHYTLWTDDRTNLFQVLR